MKLFFYSFMLSAVVLFASQNNGKWVTCSGEAVVENITTDQARNLALNRARLKAIETVCGTQIQSESLVRDFMMAGDFIHTISHGNAIKEKNIEWQTETLENPGNNQPAVMVYKVTMDVFVVSQKERPDPAFKVNLKLNRSFYRNNDEVVFKVKASKNCYITILNIAANDSVYVLFPNAIQSNTYVRKNKRVSFPDDGYRDTGLQIRVATLPGHDQDSEVVKVIATKSDIPFLDGMGQSTTFSSIGTPTMAVSKLAEWLSRIPVRERAEASAVYEVRR